MKYRRILIPLFTLLLFFGEIVFALENSYPTIAGKTINETSGFLDFVAYGFVACIAIGGVIMFAVLLRAGFVMATGAGNGATAKRELFRSAIGLFLLLCTYLIINTINSSILSPSDIDKPCVDGISMETVSENDEKDIHKLCIKSSLPEIGKIKEVKPSSFTSCAVKSVISYSNKNYEGVATTLFNDTTSRTVGCKYTVNGVSGKSVKIVPKLAGIYLYDQGGYKVGSPEAPVYLGNGSEDLSQYGFDNKSRSINVISLDYSKNPLKNPDDPDDSIIYNYYGALLFEHPGYRGKCLTIDATNNALKTEKTEINNEMDLSGEDGSAGISSAVVFNKKVHKKESDTKSYVYLYAVPNCGENKNQDDEVEKEKELKEEEEEKKESSENFLSFFLNPIQVISQKFTYSLNKLPTPNSIISLASKDIKKTFNIKTDIGTAYAKDITSTSYNEKKESFEISEKENTEQISPAEPLPDINTDPIFGVGGLYDVCKIEIPKIGAKTSLGDFEKSIAKECEGLFKKTADGKTYDIISFKFGGPAIVAIRGSNDNCLYWNSASIEKTGSCVSELRGSDIFDTSIISNVIGTAARPKNIIIIPKD
ncbi:hypothetical protein M0R01_00250 [bacterium]|nr:hypothetical protein [bacterium]